MLEVRWPTDDLGRVIGRGGRVANAIRTVAKAAATREDKRVLVDIVGLKALVRLDVFTLFPEWFEWFVAQRHVRNARRAGQQAPLLQPPGHDAAERRPGRRRALRRRRRDGDARRRGRCRARGAPTRTATRPGAVVLLTPSGRPVRRGARERARGRAGGRAALRPLRGVRRAGPRAPRHRRRLDRPATCSPAASWPRWWSPTRCSASCPARWATPRARSRSRSPRRWRARPSTRTTRGPPPTAAGRFPRSCSRAITRGSGSGACEQSRERAAAAGTR